MGEGGETPTRLRKRSLDIAGHRTSVSLEDAFWSALRDLAAAQGVSLAGLIARIDAARQGENLSSAIRVYVLEQVRQSKAPPAP
jgi:predicted DNA-binding ribbon-helix-helix protein